jgi:hypothetical protein
LPKPPPITVESRIGWLSIGELVRRIDKMGREKFCYRQRSRSLVAKWALVLPSARFHRSVDWILRGEGN